MSAELDFSIVTARNLGLQKKQRESKHVGIETFLLQTLALYGLNDSDIINIALEKYLIEKKYLTAPILQTLETVSALEKKIIEKNL